jgi:glyoxylase-like metal-dependent hydrolase (beta-lactamase superfamily II)
MAASLRRVLELPPSTRLLGGHRPETTLEEERRNNPFLTF